MVLPDLSAITSWLTTLETILPLPIFVIIGSVLEELISPIPATLVLGLAGSYVALHGSNLPYLLLLIVLGTVGKTLAAWVTYWLGRLLGKFVVARWGKYLGYKTSDLDDVALRLKSKNVWGWIFALRALPLAPSAAVSIAAGILHLSQQKFTSATFLGYIIRNLLTAFAGYAGIDIFANWRTYSENPVYGIIAAIILTLVAIYFFLKAYRQYGTNVSTSKPRSKTNL